MGGFTCFSGQLVDEVRRICYQYLKQSKNNAKNMEKL